MRTLIIGVDSGTQSTKAVVVDARTGKVVGSGSQAYGLILNLPAGAKEAPPAAAPLPVAAEEPDMTTFRYFRSGGLPENSCARNARLIDRSSWRN